MENETEFKRVISLPFLIFYGVGTIVGGGFYALLGKVVGSAGYFTPIAFFLATLIALFSALSYAELSSRYPVSAGEAYYVKKAFSNEGLSYIVGWLVIFTGVVSTATLTVAMAGFLEELIPLTTFIYIFFIIVFMALIAMWGIKESVWFSTIITIIEVGGLLFIVYIASDSFEMMKENAHLLLPSFSLELWQGIFVGMFLVFYAFIGFEDMVNIAQEVKDVKRALPIAIITSIAMTFVIYLLVSMVAIFSMDLDVLAASASPLAEIAKREGEFSYMALWSIGILAGLNGALVQIIMASRVLYGISKNSERTGVFARINARTGTPIYATLLVVFIVLLLALSFDLVLLAKITSTIILVLFAVVNASLIVIKKREGRHKEFNLPSFLPYIGLFSSLAILVVHLLMLF
ncbi:MAG: Amino acid/polyamine/organocation transporter (APC superfamily) [uncultured Sulfurovum sp.]|uniref:Amino acid/polyamine/organocation transporter (APC superfamily) n=1 Tax=uncultured Sulfurovum sp. TaxID=269237 RepID=A0A6S6SXD0_9BACT|nr:MAG: Amino acid/polyamine/organocation transporter (APC superfamily) [uncultured Sulfurovum sp.]